MGNSNSVNDKPRIEKQIIFKSKHGEVFRIPAIYYNENEKMLFAFAEKRTSQDDSDTVALVMRTGKVKRKSGVKWSEPEEVMKKCACGFRPMNPCVVYEKHTQTLFLFFIYVNKTEKYQLQHHQNAARLCYITKKNNDDKWSKFTEVIELQSMFKNWSTFAIGPGHGIQTKSGRMIIPAYAYTKGNNVPHSFCFYSDDKGKTWECEEMLKETSFECEMAEILDSKGDSLIYCNARNKGGNRVQAEIDENGFHTFEPDTSLKELHKGCQGSVISFPAQPEDTKTSQEKWLLFSHPVAQNKFYAWQRLDLGVYLSSSPVNSSGNSSGEWSQPWVINKGPSGYSDLTYIEDGWFACLMECGEKTANEIACQVFSYDEVLKGIKG